MLGGSSSSGESLPDDYSNFTNTATNDGAAGAEFSLTTPSTTNAGGGDGFKHPESAVDSTAGKRKKERTGGMMLSAANTVTVNDGQLAIFSTENRYNKKKSSNSSSNAMNVTANTKQNQWGGQLAGGGGGPGGDHFDEKQLSSEPPQQQQQRMPHYPLSTMTGGGTGFMSNNTTVDHMGVNPQQCNVASAAAVVKSSQQQQQYPGNSTADAIQPGNFTQMLLDQQRNHEREMRQQQLKHQLERHNIAHRTEQRVRGNMILGGGQLGNQQQQQFSTNAAAAMGPNSGLMMQNSGGGAGFMNTVNTAGMPNSNLQQNDGGDLHSLSMQRQEQQDLRALNQQQRILHEQLQPRPGMNQQMMGRGGGGMLPLSNNAGILQCSDGVSEDKLRQLYMQRQQQQQQQQQMFQQSSSPQAFLPTLSTPEQQMSNQQFFAMNNNQLNNSTQDHFQNAQLLMPNAANMNVARHHDVSSSSAAVGIMNVGSFGNASDLNRQHQDMSGVSLGAETSTPKRKRRKKDPNQPKKVKAPPPAVAPVTEPCVTTDLSLPVKLPNDDAYLSTFQCAIRDNLEFFVAQKIDTEYGVQGRKAQVQMGQVGVRCVHCKHFPTRKRGRGAVYFPTSCSAVYQASQNMYANHLNNSCPSIDANTRQSLNTLRNDRLANGGGGGKPYWAQACFTSGLVEDVNCLRLPVRNLKDKSHG